MSKKFLWLFSVAITAGVLIANALESRENGKSTDKTARLSKVTGQPRSTRLNINNVSQWWRADGRLSRDPRTGGSGVFFPRGFGTQTNVIFADGFVWGGFVDDGRTP
ncbi:hypothetical protein GWN42_19385, partial [candidate division KSB1 bacterium]|nr:hypothetical protein [candidate division KSB1 bacterium]